MPSIDRAAREEILTETLARMDAVPIAQLTAEVLNLTDAEEDEEEAMEPEQIEKEGRDIRKAEVARALVDDIMEVAMDLFPQGDARQTKLWNEHLLVEIACLVFSNVEGVTEQQAVRQYIIDEWMKTVQQHQAEFEVNDRQFRMYSEIQRWLNANGWQDEATRYQKRALRRQSKAVRAQRYLQIWEKRIAQVAELAFA
jgi:uncharacterized protein (DUF1786 family)